MKECDIFRVGVKRHSDPSYIFSGVKTLQPLQDLPPPLSHAAENACIVRVVQAALAACTHDGCTIHARGWRRVQIDATMQA